MRTTYGVIWQEGAGPLARGKLELLPLTLHLEGLAGSTPVQRELAYAELDAVRVARTSADRLNGHPTLLLEPHHGNRIILASAAQAGVVAELTERLAKLTVG
jgi:hypothetical protein